ncbi:hypothetical protein conserved [Leishmania donovani]|uniref:Uncharacterized protein n=3 Tax=Leishmania donovani species complex TaxID=38574 RepID=A4ICQ5_LEIIN|nr:hypothetical protein, unknown function [Leishmania infantum JPCM5]CAC9549110.1 hypothetical_protein_-_conserved [Leishmania infantum]CAJ1993444.1 hypothetical protein conserved [Leishmania donovani]CAM72633.1 hypothetical protein, unknown function [Leishmania infantum JPCM5]SUZ46456.1 hypothetical_protein_-_conserved [Leishmania infantum]VDZ49270.1 hypothetical_protein_conserved [Leishmania donovani]|eukprot:XP_001469524.1 hypothetical protein, unknown function [Leishmania infantum JPCM5]
MERDKPPPALRFARQWTLPSSSASDAGFATLAYPSWHTESPSPFNRSQVPLTPSPDRAGRRQPLEGSLAPGSPSPIPPSELSALTSGGAAHHTDASLQRASRPVPAAPSASNVAARCVQPVMLASDADGKSFWRRQAQRLEAKCAALEEELKTVYRVLGKEANDIPRALEASSHTSLMAAGSVNPTYETVAQERDMARLELTREREKNFLLRHRLREMDAEVHRLQSRHARDVGKQRVGDASKRASPSSKSVSKMGVLSSRHQRASSRCCSSSCSSTQSTRDVRRSPIYPRSRSITRPYTSSSAKREESPRPTPAPVSTSSAHYSDNSMITRSSTASTSSSTHRESGRRAANTSAAAPAAFGKPRGRSTHSPLKPSRQATDPYEAEARDLLTWLLSARPSSSSPSRCQPFVWRKGAAGSRGPEPLRRSNLESPPRRVRHNDLFSATVAVSEGEGNGGRLAHGTARGAAKARPAIRDSRLLSPIPLQQERDAADDEKARDHPTGAVRSLCAMPLQVRAPRSAAGPSRDALSGKGALRGHAGDGEWIAWQPHVIAPGQQSGGA